ncbi:MAG TPA: TIM-barrel domain-containing protein, partial [Rectinemataceae bacterium]|nr:TIM-barrel domain-containing protein [Rectinemataceae bacterium]
LNKRNRSFKLFNKDSLGYDAALSDPLYKSVPFFIKMNRERSTLSGLYFPNLRVDEVNFGVESRFYYHINLDDGPFGYYLMTGDCYRDVLSSYCELVGKPALPPLFSFGYLASSMAYTDPDDAKERILGFFDRAEAADIPCEGMYFSSGYAKADNGERYTFVWNKEKFAEPLDFLQRLRQRGYRVCCNVKPGILSTHPWYKDLAERGVFIPDAEGRPLISYYWGNSASFVDFSREEGYNWWVKALTENIIEQGASGVWNDNNEFEIEDETLPIQACRKYLPVQMAQASYEALKKANPGKRPWLISRAGYAGLQRYARTWTGDNVSDYDTLRFNIAMGLNLGLSGLPIYGHDLGGFFGQDPDKELLLRWCQSAVFQPRFVMHSWKADGKLTEPWTFPETLGTMRYFIRERYRFLPYIYDLAIRAAETGLPMESALALEFPGDPALSYDTLDRMAGDAVLIPGPPERGSTEICLHFPASADWFDPFSKKLYRGGTEAKLSYPLDSLRYFFRCGTAVPTSLRCESVGDKPLLEFLFLLFPPAGEASMTCFHSEDDGESDFVGGSHWRYSMEFEKLGEGRNKFTMTLERRARDEAFGRLWRFAVPENFSIESLEDGRALGKEIEYKLHEAPESITFIVRGDYL